MLNKQNNELLAQHGAVVYTSPSLILPGSEEGTVEPGEQPESAPAGTEGVPRAGGEPSQETRQTMDHSAMKTPVSGGKRLKEQNPVVSSEERPRMQVTGMFIIQRL